MKNYLEDRLESLQRHLPSIYQRMLRSNSMPNSFHLRWHLKAFFHYGWSQIGDGMVVDWLVPRFGAFDKVKCVFINPVDCCLLPKSSTRWGVFWAFLKNNFGKMLWEIIDINMALCLYVLCYFFQFQSLHTFNVCFLATRVLIIFFIYKKNLAKIVHGMVEEGILCIRRGL